MLSRTNLLMLREILGNRLIQTRPPYASSMRRDAWRGHVDGINDVYLAGLLETIAAESVTHFFLDGSNFGAAAAHVKTYAPHVRIITFFHNVETRFFWGSLRERRSPKALAVLAANYFAERRAVKYSDMLVTLSERDSAGLRHLYGRGADTIAPMVVEDRAATLPPPLPKCTEGGHYLLFVGGGFYANIAGIRWFVRTVAPHLPLPVRVVGRGMEELASEFAASPHAELIGAVDDLAPWYAGAALVIAPIFDGSGMKTKVAEALMFGKHVIGTPESFSGYAHDVVAANRCCANRDDFIAAIEEAIASPPPRFDPAMRAFYERDHSPLAARTRLARILNLARV